MITRRALAVLAAVAVLPLTVTSCACASADDGNTSCVNDQTNEHRKDPNPPAPPAPKPGGPKRCDYLFNFTWHRIHGGGVLGSYGAVAGETIPFHNDANSGGFHKTLFGQPCAGATSEIHPVKVGTFPGRQGDTSCSIENVTVKWPIASDSWPDETAGSNCHLAPSS